MSGEGDFTDMTLNPSETILYATGHHSPSTPLAGISVSSCTRSCEKKEKKKLTFALASGTDIFVLAFNASDLSILWGVSYNYFNVDEGYGIFYSADLSTLFVSGM